MIWYIEIIKWIFIAGIIYIILKEIVPKWVWARLETMITNWQLSAVTKHYEGMDSMGRKNKGIFILAALVIGVASYFLFSWWIAILIFLFFYFGFGTVLMQMGWIE